jgi:hypothetical protein
MSTDYISDRLRADVFSLDNGACVYCGNPGDCIDHYIPQVRYGPPAIDNLYTCCRSCNSTKGDRPIYDVGLMLRFGRFSYTTDRRVDETPSAAGGAVQWTPDPDISPEDELTLLALARRPNGHYRFTAEKIATLMKGDRNKVMAIIREIRGTPPPAEFRQPDGSTAPAARPITS